jgi:hypothetical protein
VPSPQQQNRRGIINDISSRIDLTELSKNWERVKRERSAWESKWNEVQDFVFPNHENYAKRPTIDNSSSSVTTSESPLIQNYTAAVVGKVNLVVSWITGLLADPSTDWFQLRFKGMLRLANGMRLSIGENEIIQRYCTSCKLILYDLFSDPASNFYPSTHALYFDWYTLGNGCRAIILRADNSQILFNTVPMADVFIETGGYGDIKNIYRRYNLSPRQAYDIWGENLHSADLQLINGHADNRTKEYVEVCMPNPFLGEIGQTLPFLTVAFDVQNKHLLSYGYHARSPYVISRFAVKSGESYGHTVLWDAIPDIKTINKLSKIILVGAAFNAHPVYLVRDATSLMASHIKPGAILQGLTRDGRPEIQTLGNGTNQPFELQYYQFQLNNLDEVLLARDMILPDTPGMTATEVNERRIQVANRIRPMMVRLEKEDLNNTVLRTLSLMSFLGRLPPFPYAELADDLSEKLEVDWLDANTLAALMPDPIDQIDVSFSGQMNHMQRLNEVRNNSIFLQEVRAVAEIQSFNSPIVDRSISLDEFLKNSAEVYDIRPSVAKSSKESAKVAAQQQVDQDEMMRMHELEVQQKVLENTRQQLENDKLAEETA